MATAAEIRVLLARLDGASADALESETLEFKSWDRDVGLKGDQLRDLRETVVCFANAQGGDVILGIQDRRNSRRDAIHGVGTLDERQLRRLVYDGTEPSILVETEELIEPEGRVLLVRVPRGLPPHTTTQGVGKIRVGTECKPLTGSGMARLMFAGGQRDLSAEPVPGATLDDLDPAQIERLRRTIHTEGASGRLAELASKDLVAALGLVRDGAVTMAAILLFGTPTAIDRWAGQHEVVFLRFRDPTRPDVRHDLREPLLATLARLEDLLTAHSRIETIEQPLFREIEIPDLSWWVAREAVLNALVHRDYFLRQSVYVELRPGRVEITSPGGFVGGVSASNVLRHPPVRRNPLLAEVLQTAGLVNRAGLGVDRIFEELLALGKSMPRYEADEAHVRLTLPTRTHRPFAQFVAEQRQQGRPLGLDDLILLRTVTERGSIDRWSAAQQLQLPEDEAASRLAELRRRGHFVAHGRGRGTAYRLTRKLSDRLRGPDVTDQELALDGEAVRLRLQAVLAERGSLTNADVRRISGYSRGEAVRLMRQLRDAGLAVLQGRGRGAHYRPGPALKQ